MRYVTCRTGRLGPSAADPVVIGVAFEKAVENAPPRGTRFQAPSEVLRMVSTLGAGRDIESREFILQEIDIHKLPHFITKRPPQILRVV